MAMLGRSLCTAILMAFATSSALGATPPSVLAQFTKTSVEASLKQANATNIIFARQQELDVVKFESGGLNYNFALTVCSSPLKCRGLQMLIFFRADGKPYSLKAINGFNQNYAFANATLMPDGKLALSRYLISDGGITQENLNQNLGTFLKMPAELAKFLTKANSGLEATATPDPAAVVTVANEFQTLNILSGISQGNALQAIEPVELSKPAQ